MLANQPKQQLERKEKKKQRSKETAHRQGQRVSGTITHLKWKDKRGKLGDWSISSCPDWELPGFCLDQSGFGSYSISDGCVAHSGFAGHFSSPTFVSRTFWLWRSCSNPLSRTRAGTSIQIDSRGPKRSEPEVGQQSTCGLGGCCKGRRTSGRASPGVGSRKVSRARAPRSLPTRVFQEEWTGRLGLVKAVMKYIAFPRGFFSESA